jgi:hypothetical protein
MELDGEIVKLILSEILGDPSCVDSDSDLDRVSDIDPLREILGVSEVVQVSD